MAIHNQAPDVVTPRTHRLHDGSRSSILHFAVPMLFAAMGISLGTLTGVAFAFATVPVGAQSAVSDSAPATSAAKLVVGQNAPSPATAEPVVSQSELSVPNADSQAAATAEVADNSSNSQAISDHSIANQAESDDSPANLAKADRSPAEQTPADGASTDKSDRSSSARKVLVSASETASAAMTEQTSLDADSNSTGFYSEGDLTVADYNPLAGTIETSDGRTFALGTTVSVDSASSWEDYRSNVHYKCGQNGSCMLFRHGAVAPNARLIDRGRTEDSGLTQGI
jgi:hypothetical protein